MFNTSRATIDKIIIHKVGNKSKEEGFFISDQLFSPDSNTENVLLDYFTKPLNNQPCLSFSHEENLSLNPMYSSCISMFNHEHLFTDQSEKIVSHLYDSSTHPNIKGGEVYIIYFKDIYLNEVETDAIGIFKSENKDNFIKINEKETAIDLSILEGISLNKLDKGCLVFNTMEESGFNVYTVDNNNKEAQFWTDIFLGVTEQQDNRFHTNKYVEMIKEYSDTTFGQEEEPEGQIQFMNKAYDYMQGNEHFDVDQFNTAVFEDPYHQERFMDFRNNYMDSHNVTTADEFQIEKKSAQQMSKYLRKKIKLDDSIEVNINLTNLKNGNEVIEKGYDEEKDMHYYKLYFKEEK